MYGTTLITGATGLLGAELVNQLLESGESSRLVCLVRDFVPLSRFFTEGMERRVCVVRGDVRDLELISRTINEYDVRTIFHLAAQTLVEKANDLPTETLDVNIRGTWSVLEAARRHQNKVKAIVVASSDKAYGDLSGEKYDEQYPLAGRFPYDVSKSCTDLVTQSYAKSYGLNAAITRCGNFFGPGDLNENRIFPSTILSLLRNERPVLRSNGKYIRDYLYIADAASAYRSLATQMLQKPLSGEAFNFSYGLRMTVLDVVQSIKAAMGSRLEPVIQGTAENEIPTQSLDSTKAKTVLGWIPKYGFEEGIMKTIAWYTQYYQPQLPKLKAVG